MFRMRFITLPEARRGHRDGAGALCALRAARDLRRRSTSDGATVARATEDQGYALVQLKGEPSSPTSRRNLPHGKKIDFNSNTVKSYRAQLSALRNDFKQWLRANAPKAKVTGEYDISLNAVAVQLNGEALATIAAAPQVLRAQYQGLYYPTTRPTPIPRPDQRAAGLGRRWRRPADRRQPASRSRIIDTGIDITHPCFSDAGYPGADAARRHAASRTTRSSPPRSSTTRRRASTTRRGDAGPRHARLRHGRLRLRHAGGRQRRRRCRTTMSGVAPRALLGNYNVFPGDVENARIRGHPQRARCRVRRRLRRREHEPRRRLRTAPRTCS